MSTLNWRSTSADMPTSSVASEMVNPKVWGHDNLDRGLRSFTQIGLHSHGHAVSVAECHASATSGKVIRTETLVVSKGSVLLSPMPSETSMVS